MKSIEKVTRNTALSVCMYPVLVMLGTKDRDRKIGLLSWDHSTLRGIPTPKESLVFSLLSEVEVIPICDYFEQEAGWCVYVCVFNYYFFKLYLY